MRGYPAKRPKAAPTLPLAPVPMPVAPGTPGKGVPRLLRHKDGRAYVKFKGRVTMLPQAGTPAADEAYRQFLATNVITSVATVEGEFLSEGPSVDSVMAGFYLEASGTFIKRGKPTAYVAGIRRAKHYLKASGLGRYQAEAFKPTHLRAFQEWLATLPHQPLGVKTINEYVAIVVRAFRWAVVEGTVVEPVHRALALLPRLRAGRSVMGVTPRPSRKRLPPDPDHKARTLAKMSPHQRMMVQLQEMGAMRPAEVCAMRRDLLKPVKHKGAACLLYTVPDDVAKMFHRGRGDLIVLGPRAAALIEARLKKCGPEEHLFSPAIAIEEMSEARRGDRKTPMWPSHTPEARARRRRRAKIQPREPFADHYTPETYAKFILAAVARAFPHPEISKVPPAKRTPAQVLELKKWIRRHAWTPYQLRHEGATRIALENSLPMAQALLGHADPQTTMNYVHARDKVNNLLDAAAAAG